MAYEVIIYPLLIIIIYILIVYILWKKKILERLNISFFGPFLMWRTKRGKIFIDKLSQKRSFWHVYGIISIIIILIAMVLMSIIILLGAIAAMFVQAEPIPPEQILALPGLNPLIPLWYGIFALAIAVVIHEFAHGILANLNLLGYSYVLYL